MLLRARSCEQSVEMCPHGSPSAEAAAWDPGNSADSAPACDPARKPHAPARDAGQVHLRFWSSCKSCGLAGHPGAAKQERLLAS